MTKILQLCKKMPFPPKDGEGFAVMSFSESYNLLNCEIDLLSFNTSKHFVDQDQISAYNSPYTKVESVYLDNSINYLDAFLNIFSNSSYNINRFISDNFKSKLIELLRSRNYDIVQLESLYMAPYIDAVKEYSSAKIIMRSHNIESNIWDDLARSNSNPVLKWYYKLCANRLKEFELENINKYDLLLAISEPDAQIYSELNKNSNTLVCPVGVDTNAKVIANKIGNEFRIGYLGSLDWNPNIEALKWFFENVWSDIVEIYPDIKFHLAGRNAVREILNINMDSIVYHGEVSSSSEFINSLNAVVVPLFSGSGIRVKILESMALSKLVISTNKGFEGIEIENNTHGIIANNAAEFKTVILRVLNNEIDFDKIGQMARNFITERFDRVNLAKMALDSALEDHN